ncbi:hemin ABC transporter substrate-binding protein (plasmid) [Azospirillum brasilense]|uniref:Hemin ABC transporter substrate-binding protein n=1 Tax=Azospirillum brasilense TaxID=192 RepID=A0A4D8RCC3_AZOBR|nr:ABC transporter substrate-binding protein [Azospirillum brasilense]QCO19601.1 hemin ABC transporter substrate-binding protein [Azospirillum brasilense]
MRRLRFLPAAIAATLALTATTLAGAAERRIVTVGPPVTELVYALGDGGSVVGRDTSSHYPQPVNGLPDVGYMRALSAEGVMSLAPTHVLAIQGAGPETTLDQLRALGVTVEVVPETPTLAGLLDKVERVARLLGREAEGRRLADSLNRDLAALAAVAAKSDAKSGAKDGAPVVLGVVGGGPGGLMAAGSRSVPAALIAMAGGRNALEVERDYVPMSSEAVLAAAPDILLVSRSLVDRSGGLDPFLATPQIALTPAAKARRVAVVDGALLMGLGPRTAEAVAELTRVQGTSPQGQP